MSASTGVESAPIGVLLSNIGTPNSTDPSDVRRYLAEFLSDPRVIDINPVARWLLLHGIILRTRPKKSAEKYAEIWTDEGSPLLVYTQHLKDGLQKKLGSGFHVAIGMRYGDPSIPSAFRELEEAGCTQVVIVPLYPQQTSSSVGSCVARCNEVLTKHHPKMDARYIEPFYHRSDYIQVIIDAARPAWEALQPDHVLFSYHSIPERHIRKEDPTGSHCLATDNCCETITDTNRHCYRAQCFETSRLLAKEMGLQRDQWSIGFQSRLGRTPWIQPVTTEVVENDGPLGQRLLVLVPSFTTDCLETLEEVRMDLKERFLESGGVQFETASCPNAHPSWVQTLASWIKEEASIENPV